MTAWVALLRAVNVGGTGKLPMAELKALCEGLGFAQVRTYIASGNVVFTSTLGEAAVRSAIEQAIEAQYGKRIGVQVRCADELARVLTDNPFPEAAGNRLLILFTDAAPSLDGLRHQAGERLALGERAIYVDYGEGMGQSKLVVPAAKHGTMRNLNTVSALAAMAAVLD